MHVRDPRLVTARPALLAVALFALTVPVSGLAQARCRPLCTPVLLLQPGFISADVVGDGTTDVDFNLRVVAAVPTAWTRTRVTFGAQWAPFREVDGATRNEPTLYYGPTITVLNTGQFAVELNALGAFGPAARAEDAAERSYTHKLVLQGDLLFKAGARWANPLGRWRDVALYLMAGYQATGIEDEASPWQLLGGVSIPITP